MEWGKEERGDVNSGLNVETAKFKGFDNLNKITEIVFFFFGPILPFVDWIIGNVDI